MAIPRFADLNKRDRRGTRGFRAPEVLRGSILQTSGVQLSLDDDYVTCQSAIDLWSAGIILMTLLCRNKLDSRISRPQSDTIASTNIEALFGTQFQPSLFSLNKPGDFDLIYISQIN